jgi:two-component system LytT family response regulator
MRALIVDDEAPARAKLRRLLAAERDVEVAGEASNGAAAVGAIRELAPDVVFLDIQMPRLDGFGVVRDIGVERMPRVVFVTAHDEHALRAFEVEAFDYLLKPVAPDRFARVVERLRRDLAREPADLAERLGRLLDRMDRRGPAPQRLLVEDGDRQVFLDLADVDRIDAARNCVEIHARGRTYLLRTPIGQLAGRLDPAVFLRINRSQIVHLDRVRELQPWFHGEFRVVLRDGTTLTWTRRYRRDAQERFTVTGKRNEE